MSTRGIIAVEDADGQCRSIAVHFDMYPSGGGEILSRYFTNLKRINDLLALGDLSAVGRYLSPSEADKDYRDPEWSVCISYHRDYGEPYHGPCVWQSAAELVDRAWDVYGVEFAYLFRKGEWLIQRTFPKSGGWVPLKTELEKIDD